MKIFLWCIAFLCLPFLANAVPPLGAAAELTLDSPWSEAVALEFPGSGPFRLEATGLGGEPVEVLVERSTDGRSWQTMGTNRTLQGTVEAVVEFQVGSGDQWRVRPPKSVSKTVVLRLKRAAFAALKETLKQTLSPGPAVSLPLRWRADLPLRTGGASLTAATDERGGLWVAWLSPSGQAEVWDAARGQPLGDPLDAPSRARLELTAADGPHLRAEGDGGATAWAWNGQNWLVEAAATSVLTTAQGTFRSEERPVPRVWRSAAGGWLDLELPQNRMLDRLLLASTEDGLYAFLGSSTGRERALYLWHAGEGWTALPPPSAEGPPRQGLWAATNGAGSLFFVEGQGPTLTLQQFDGSDWRPPLDLAALAPAGVQALCLLPPSPWSRTGSLVLATDRVAVYDLP